MGGLSHPFLRRKEGREVNFPRPSPCGRAKTRARGDQQTMDSVAVRAEVFAVYNKRREDFLAGEQGDQAWNDYLEEREDVAFALSEGGDGEADDARERLEAYRGREAASIAHNAALAAQEARDAEARELAALKVANLPGGGLLRVGPGEEVSGSFVARGDVLQPGGSAAEEALPSAPSTSGANDGGAIIGGDTTTIDQLASASHITPDESLGPAELAERQRMRHRAGGYSVKLHKRRNLEEAMAAINMLLLEVP